MFVSLEFSIERITDSSINTKQKILRDTIFIAHFPLSRIDVGDTGGATQTEIDDDFIFEINSVFPSQQNTSVIFIETVCDFGFVSVNNKISRFD